MELQDFIHRAESAEKKLALLQQRCERLENAIATADAQRGNAQLISHTSCITRNIIETV